MIMIINLIIIIIVIIYALRQTAEIVNDRIPRGDFPTTEEPRNSAFLGTCGFYALWQEMLYC